MPDQQQSSCKKCAKICKFLSIVACFATFIVALWSLYYIKLIKIYYSDINGDDITQSIGWMIVCPICLVIFTAFALYTIYTENSKNTIYWVGVVTRVKKFLPKFHIHPYNSFDDFNSNQISFIFQFSN